MSTVKATRACNFIQLRSKAEGFLKQMSAMGVTTVEAVSYTHLYTVRSDVGDDAIGHFPRSIVDDAQLLHLLAATGRKAEGGHYTGIEYNKRCV